jgi:hypothetical protein
MVFNDNLWYYHKQVIFLLRIKVRVFSSDGQLAARGLIYSGPRQVSGLFSKILTSQRNGIELSF